MIENTGVRTSTRYGILGGTFDPPHLGHLVLAQEVYTRLGLDCVWFVPTGTPPHKAGRPVTTAAHRAAMVELAIAGDARFALSSVELSRSGPSYTVETLPRLRDQWGTESWLCFIMGWDMLIDLPDWHDAPGLLAALDAIAVVHRPGFEVDEHVVERLETDLPGLREKLRLVPAPQLDLAATTLRERVASGLPITYLVPEPVRQYIEEQRLYVGTASFEGERS